MAISGTIPAISHVAVTVTAPSPGPRWRLAATTCPPRRGIPGSERPAGQFLEPDRVQGHAAAGAQDDLVAAQRDVDVRHQLAVRTACGP
jgi:hypothetical protein